jgi:hypothetical protein
MSRVKDKHDVGRLISTLYHAIKDLESRIAKPAIAPPTPYVIRCRLSDENEFYRLLSLTPLQLVKTLRCHNRQLHRVRAAQLSREQNGQRTLRIHVATLQEEIDLRTCEDLVRAALELGPGFCMIPERYCVEGHDFGLNRITFSTQKINKTYRHQWSKENKVSIQNACWDSGRLILELSNLADAVKLCRSPVWLSAHAGYVV